MRISYTKAHGTRNDFLLTWTSEAPQQRLEEAARAICDRHTGIGPLEVRWDEAVYMTGPAEIVGRGEYYWE